VISRWNFCKIGWYCVSSRGSNPPKTTQKGAWIGISSQTRKALKLAYYRNHCTDSNQILHSDKDQQMLFVGGPNTRKKSRWRTAAILKNRKSAISPQKFDRSAQHLASWSISALWTGLCVKNFNFYNPRWRTPPSWKNKKAAMSPQRFDRSALNLAWWRILALQTGPAVKIFNFKNSGWRTAVIRNWKPLTSNISTTVDSV